MGKINSSSISHIKYVICQAHQKKCKGKPSTMFNLLRKLLSNLETNKCQFQFNLMFCNLFCLNFIFSHCQLFNHHYVSVLSMKIKHWLLRTKLKRKLLLITNTDFRNANKSKQKFLCFWFLTDCISATHISNSLSGGTGAPTNSVSMIWILQ